MSDTIECELQNTADFFQVGRRGIKAWAEDRDKGASIFLSQNEHARIALVASILDAWLDEGDLNRAMASGLLRHAWDSEPYIGGSRIGSYVTSAIASLKDPTFFSVEEFIEEWGAFLMTETEERELEAMDFPLTVYRGGTGTISEGASGGCWTLKREGASFYAHEWPLRWGITRQSAIVSAKVDESEAFAFLNARNESEILIPYPNDVTDLTLDMSSTEDFSPAVKD